MKRKTPKERLKIGSKVRIRLPADYVVTSKPTPLLFSLPDYNPTKSEKENLKKWSVEQAQSRTYIDDNGNTVQLDLITTAQKIYDWVRK